MPSYLVSPDDSTLMLGMTAEDMSNVLGVSVRQARRYKALSLPLPEPCRRLLRLHRDGDLQSLFGDAWSGFVMKDDGLHVPNWEGKRGFSPEQISGMFYTFQHQAALKAQVRDLQAKVWAMDKVRESERNGSRMARIQQQVEALQAVTAALLVEFSDSVTRSELSAAAR